MFPSHADIEECLKYFYYHQNLARMASGGISDQVQVSQGLNLSQGGGQGGGLGFSSLSKNLYPA